MYWATFFQNVAPPFMRTEVTPLSPFPYQVLITLFLAPKLLTRKELRRYLALLLLLTGTLLSTRLPLGDLQIYYSLLYLFGPLVFFVLFKDRLKVQERHCSMLLGGFIVWTLAAVFQDFFPDLGEAIFSFLIEIPVEFQRSSEGRGKPSFAYEPSVSADYLVLFIFSFFICRHFNRAHYGWWFAIAAAYFLTNRSGTFVLHSLVFGGALVSSIAASILGGSTTLRIKRRQLIFFPIGLLGLLVVAVAIGSTELRATQAVVEGWRALESALGTSENLILTIVEITIVQLESWRTISVAACLATLDFQQPLGYGLGGWSEAIAAGLPKVAGNLDPAMFEWIVRPYSFLAVAATDSGVLGLCIIGFIIVHRENYVRLLSSPVATAIVALCCFQILLNTTRSILVAWVVLRMVLDNADILVSARRGD